MIWRRVRRAPPRPPEAPADLAAARLPLPVAAGQPAVQGDDPAAPAAAILRQLPGAARVEILVSPAQPARRIVHLADWHFVPQDLFALDLRGASGKPLSEGDV